MIKVRDFSLRYRQVNNGPLIEVFLNFCQEAVLLLFFSLLKIGMQFFLIYYRVIFRWVIAKDLGKHNVKEIVRPNSTASLLRGVRTGKETYHQLFKKLCKYVRNPNSKPKSQKKNLSKALYMFNNQSHCNLILNVKSNY